MVELESSSLSSPATTTSPKASVLRQHSSSLSSSPISQPAITTLVSSPPKIKKDEQFCAIRSLRRRLWKAFEEEDVETAERAYTATLHQYQEWVHEEAMEAAQKRQLEEEARLQKKKEKRESRPVALRKIGSVVRSARHVMKHSSDSQKSKGGHDSDLSSSSVHFGKASRRNTARARQLMGTPHKSNNNNNSLELPETKKASLPTSASNQKSPGLLEFELQPSDPFTSDDFKCPWGTEDDPHENDENEDGYEDGTTATDKEYCNNYGKGRSPSLRKQHARQKRQQRRMDHKPRFAGFFGLRTKADLHALEGNHMLGGKHNEDLNENLGIEDSAMITESHMTTPLHEAARLGCPRLVNLMLQHGGDPNYRNGQSRTALHMAAGGLTEEEEGLLRTAYEHECNTTMKKEETSKNSTCIKANDKKYDATDKDGSGDTPFELIGSGVGIRAPVVDKGGLLQDEMEHLKNHRSTRKSLKRLFKNNAKHSKEQSEEGGKTDPHVDDKKRSEEKTTTLTIPPLTPPPLNINRLQKLSASRMDTVLDLLSWCHTGQDDPDRLGEGPSINSVDSKYRTALHYASELGRLDVCMAVLSNFGAILTLVDESGQTPCELAAARRHDALAYQLEARALLYADPYGMDDELMANVLADAEFNETENSNSAHEYPRDGDEDYEGSHALMTPSSSITASSRSRTTAALEGMLGTSTTTNAKKSNSGIARPPRHGYRRKLVPPFSWYETWDMGEVQEERSHRITITLEQMRAILREIQEQQEANEIMFSHNALVDDSMQSINSINLNNDSSAAAANSCSSSSSSDKKEEDDKDSEQEEIQQIQDTEDAVDGNGGYLYLKPNSGHSVEEFNAVAENSESIDASDDEVFLKEDGGACAPVSYEVEELPVTHNNSEADNNVATSSTNEKVQMDVPVKQELARIIHESHAEGLLSAFDWDIKKAIREFKAKPSETLKDAGVPVELNYSSSSNSFTLSNSINSSNIVNVTCLICCDEFTSSSPKLKKLSGCNHKFCSECLGEYVEDCAKSKSGLLVPCPHHECSSLLTVSEIESLAPNRGVLDALRSSADETFVAAAEDMRFCPHPGCGGVVKRLVPPYLKKAKCEKVALVNFTGAVCTAASHYDQDDEDITITYEGVRDPNYNMISSMSPPVKAHRFCFSCGENMHWPISCETLEKWKDAVREEVGTAVDEKNGETASGEESFNDVAQRLWLKANTRPCPQCNAPIEKMEGCNHMTCTNRTCRHEFCWICRKDWKLHNSETGGFFRCNRWREDDQTHDFYDTPPSAEEQSVESPPTHAERPDAPHLADQGYGSAVHSARSAWKKSRTMARFLHHYRRWIAHAESAALERHMADTACSRLAPVIEAAIEFSGFPDFNFGGKGLAFIHGAFTELLECRSLLQHSYAFAFTRYPNGSTFRSNRELKAREREKGTFEQLQSELETLSEQLSDIVARSHLRATQTQIMFLTSTSAEKRREFTVLLISILEEARKEEEKKKENEVKGNHPVHPSGGSDRYSQRPWDVAMAPPWRRRTIGDPFNSLHQETFPVRTLPPLMPPGMGGLHTWGGRGPDRDDGGGGIERVLHTGNRNQRATVHETYDGQDFDASSAGDRWAANWDCIACTYMNSHGRFCAMCGTPRNN